MITFALTKSIITANLCYKLKEARMPQPIRRSRWIIKEPEDDKRLHFRIAHEKRRPKRRLIWHLIAFIIVLFLFFHFLH